MSSAALYKAFIDAGASEEQATRAAEDVIQVSQLPELATKADISGLELSTKADISGLELSTKTQLAKLEARIASLELSTKADFSRLESSMDARFTAQELSTEAKIADLRAEMKADVSGLETRLVKWIVGTGLVYTSIVIALFSLMN